MVTANKLIPDDFEHIKGIIREVKEINAAINTLKDQKENLLADKKFIAFDNNMLFFFNNKKTKKLVLQDVVAKFTKSKEYESWVALKPLIKDNEALYTEIKDNYPNLFKMIQKKSSVKYEFTE